MTQAIFTFAAANLEDTDAMRAESINGLSGCACAQWLREGLKDLAIDAPVAEDWGWALVVRIGPDSFVIGCAADEDYDAGHWRVIVSDNSNPGLFSTTRTRKAAARAELARKVEAFLRAEPRVSEFGIESGA